MEFTNHFWKLRQSLDSVSRTNNALMNNMTATRTVKILFLCPPKGPEETKYLISKIPTAMRQYVSSYDLISSDAEYKALPAKDYDVIFVQMGISCATLVLTD